VGVLKAPVWEYNTTLAAGDEGINRRNQPEKRAAGKVFWPQMMAVLIAKQDLRGNSWGHCGV